MQGRDVQRVLVVAPVGPLEQPGHAQVDPGAAGSTVLEDHLRIPLLQTLEDVVEVADVPHPELPALGDRHLGPGRIAHVTVHVQLEVVELVFPEQGIQRAEQMVAHVVPGVSPRLITTAQRSTRSRPG